MFIESEKGVISLLDVNENNGGMGARWGIRGNPVGDLLSKRIHPGLCCLHDHRHCDFEERSKRRET